MFQPLIINKTKFFRKRGETSEYFGTGGLEVKVKERIRFSWEKPLGGGASTLNENIWYGIFRFKLKLYNSAVITLKKLI